jgi:hypothetical protein
MCHELGHHLGGFAFKSTNWAANEGQADYFSTQVCARKLWAGDPANQQAANNVDAYARAECNKIWNKVADQNICYRISAAGQALATLLSVIEHGGVSPKFDRPDTSVVQTTNPAHPKAQCRLDTFFAGSLCPVKFDLSVIPGRNNPAGQLSKEAEKEAYKYSCGVADGYDIGVRPLCWFKPKLTAKK